MKFSPNALWALVGSDMSVEWSQCLSEGRDVADLADFCRLLEQKSRTEENWEAVAQALAERMRRIPVRADFGFVEPTAYDDIVKERPNTRPTLTNDLTAERLRDKIKGMWTGRIAGCAMGKPYEGMTRDKINRIVKETNNFPMKRYTYFAEFSPELIKAEQLRPNNWTEKCADGALIDDDTNYTAVNLRMLKDKGRDFTSENVLQYWAVYVPIGWICSAERVALRNYYSGYTAEETALINNPYREMIGAQIRADLYGFINPGDIEAAAEMAWRDAVVAEVGNGVYGSMFAAAMIAAAAVCDDMEKVVEAGLAMIPARCRLRADIDKVLGWYHEGLDSYSITDRIHMLYDPANFHWWGHTLSNAMIVATALLCGKKDFGRTIGIAVESAFDTDCNGATAGAVLGAMLGASGLDRTWADAFGGKVKTAIHDMHLLSLDELTEWTEKLVP